MEIRILRVAAVLLAASFSFAQSVPSEAAKDPSPVNAALTADVIMARVAENQDRSEVLRKQGMLLIF